MAHVRVQFRHSELLVALLVVLLVGYASTAAEQGTGEVAYVSDSPDYVLSGNLLSALQSRATVIVLVTNYKATEHEFGAYAGNPLPIKRNLTITGLPGQNPLLDLSSRYGFLEVCSNCTLRLVNVSITTDAQKGSDSMTNAFMGLPGSIVAQENGFSVRRACQPANYTLELIRDTARSKAFPGNVEGTQQQLASLPHGPITYQGETYTNVLYVKDLAVDVQLSLGVGNIPVGGYALHRINCSRLCERTISPDCVRVKSPWQCEDEEAQRLAAEETGPSNATAPSASTTTSHPTNWCNDAACYGKIGAVAASAVVAGLLLVLGAVWLRRRRRRLLPQLPQRQYPRPCLPHDLESGNVRKDPDMVQGMTLSKDVAAVGAAATDMRSSFAFEGDAAVLLPADKHCESQLEQVHRASLPMAMQPREGPSAVAGGAGWEVSFCHTAPGLEVTGANDKIKFGQLLGAGSFARVYRGKWACLDVAVKVIQHSQETSQLVRNEVELMMSLNHPNIVRPYHCVTQRQRRGDGGGAIGGTVGAAGGAARAAGKDPRCVSLAGAAGITALYGMDDNSASTAATRPRAAEFHRAPTAAAHANSSAVLHGMTRQHSLADSGSFSLPSQHMQQDGHNPSITASSRARSHSAAVQHAARIGSDNNAPCVPQRATYAASTRISSPFASPQVQSSGTTDAAAAELVRSVLQPVAAAGSGSSSSPTDMNAAHSFIPITGPSFSSSIHRARSNDLALQQPSHSTAAAAAAAVAQTLGLSSSNAWSVISNHPLPTDLDLSGDHHAPRVTSHLEQQQPAANVSHTTPGGPDLHVNNLLVDHAPAGDKGFNGCSTEGLTISGMSAETWLVLELCDRGTLSSIAQRWEADHNDEQQMLQRLMLLQDAARGLALLHGRNIVHGDLNSHNVLVSSSSTAPSGLVGKLSDFGLSRVIKQAATHRTTRTMGTLSHMPPELLRYGRMSNSVDIYSFGIMMWEVYVCQGMPFRDLHIGQLFQEVVLQGARPAIPPGMPDDYELLMRRCWAQEPADRPSVQQLLDCLALMIEDRQQALSQQQQQQQSGSCGATSSGSSHCVGIVKTSSGC